MFSNDALRRTAVIAGVNQSGCRLARHVDRDPQQATSVTGYFDDREPRAADRRDAARVAGLAGRAA